MKAVRFHAFGGPEVLRHEDVDQPVPGVDQVRIRVTATSYNDVDAALRAGSGQDGTPVRLPHVPGVDVAGAVDALGPGVDAVAVGDRVVGLLPFTSAGAAADHVLAPVEALTGVPRRLPLADLAALPLVGLTAWQALFDHGRLTAGQRVLVHGAGGPVGGYVLQLAAEVRAQVVTDVSAAVRDPVDLVVVLAPATRQHLDALLPLLRDGGTLVNTVRCLTAPSDEERGVRGTDLVVRSDADQLADLVARVCTGELAVDVAQQVALTDLPAVHARAARGPLPGKVVVLPAGA